MAVLKVLIVILSIGYTFGAPVKITDEKLRFNIGYVWPCETTKNIYKNHNLFNSKNIIATRSVVHNDDAIIAMPRFKSGVPVTLGKISLRNNGESPVINAYPCWSLQEEGNCAALQNVVDIFLDPQGILWVLDTGVVNTLEKPVRKCPPKVVAFNLSTDKLIKVVDLSKLTTDSSRLQYVIADYGENGHVYIYVTDAESGAILVHDVTTGQSRSVGLPQDILATTSKRDVLTPVLIRRADGSTCLIFTYLSSSHIYVVSTKSLQTGESIKFHDLGQKKAKIVILGTDNGTAMFFRYEGKSDIYRWDTSLRFVEEHFDRVSTGDDIMFATHVTPDYRTERMRALESNFPDFIQGTVGCGVEHTFNTL
ncbi:protein yellow-like [Microplitis mediator]|uniref:protein yellow-like n=1 Tax=Microplitis mediator TaxID=375433 RepID=UPI002552E05D|nr:protein yellow-like [Microplitis mediator]